MPPPYAWAHPNSCSIFLPSFAATVMNNQFSSNSHPVAHPGGNFQGHIADNNDAGYPPAPVLGSAKQQVVHPGAPFVQQSSLKPAASTKKPPKKSAPKSRKFRRTWTHEVCLHRPSLCYDSLVPVVLTQYFYIFHSASMAGRRSSSQDCSNSPVQRKRDEPLGSYRGQVEQRPIGKAVSRSLAVSSSTRYQEGFLDEGGRKFDSTNAPVVWHQVRQ